MLKVKFFVPLLPSVVDTLFIEIVGFASSLVRVRIPWLSAIVAFVGVVKLIRTVSLVSNLLSLAVWKFPKFLKVSPGEKVKVSIKEV